MRGKIGVLIAFLVMVFVTAAGAMGPEQANRPLRGTYSLSGTRVCVYTAENGFDPAPFFTLTAGGNTRTTTVTGELHLFGDGTGTGDFELMQINHQLTQSGSRPISIAQSSCDVTYGTNSNGNLELIVDNCIGPVTQGGGAGGFVTTSGPQTLTVSASHGGSVLLLSGIAPDVEQVTFVIPPPPDPPSDTFISDRICSRSYTAVLVAPF